MALRTKIHGFLSLKSQYGNVLPFVLGITGTVGILAVSAVNRNGRIIEQQAMNRDSAAYTEVIKGGLRMLQSYINLRYITIDASCDMAAGAAWPAYVAGQYGISSLTAGTAVAEQCNPSAVAFASVYTAAGDYATTCSRSPVTIVRSVANCSVTTGKLQVAASVTIPARGTVPAHTLTQQATLSFPPIAAIQSLATEPGCPSGGQRVFLSSGTFAANISRDGAGGFTDQCIALATAASLTNASKFKALISTSTSNASSNINIVGRTCLVDDTTIAMTAAEFWSDSHRVPINKNESGVTVAGIGSGGVRTGTVIPSGGGSGVVPPNPYGPCTGGTTCTCSDWSYNTDDNTHFEVRGDWSRSDLGWIMSHGDVGTIPSGANTPTMFNRTVSDSCGQLKRIYCVETFD